MKAVTRPLSAYTDGAVDLNDQAIAFDGMHLNAVGNATIARGLAPTVRELAAVVATTPSR